GDAGHHRGGREQRRARREHPAPRCRAGTLRPLLGRGRRDLRGACGWGRAAMRIRIWIRIWIRIRIRLWLWIGIWIRIWIWIRATLPVRGAAAAVAVDGSR